LIENGILVLAFRVTNNRFVGVLQVVITAVTKALMPEESICSNGQLVDFIFMFKFSGQPETMHGFLCPGEHARGREMGLREALAGRIKGSV
jgi:hypothetical protein